MCGIWNPAAGIVHRKSAAGVLESVRGQDDGTSKQTPSDDCYDIDCITT